MSKKLTTSTNDVLDTLALDETIKRIEINGDYDFHISDDVKVQKYLFVGTSGILNITFDVPVLIIPKNTGYINGFYGGFSKSKNDVYIDIDMSVAGVRSSGVSVVYCFGVLFVTDGVDAI